MELNPLSPVKDPQNAILESGFFIVKKLLIKFK